jgi:hypothetical protein
MPIHNRQNEAKEKKTIVCTKSQRIPQQTTNPQLTMNKHYENSKMLINNRKERKALR